MSVEPWIDAWPRSAMMPPPGRPMLPSSSWMIAARADDLHADGVLRPADRVGDRAGAARGPSSSQSASATSEELLDRQPHASATISGRVAGEVALQDLEDAARMLERRVLVRRLRRRSSISPVAAVARLLALRDPCSRLPARRCASMPSYCHVWLSYCFSLRGSQPEKSPSRSSVSWKSLVDDHRRVRVVRDVLLEPALVLEDVVDDAAEERDVRAGTDADAASSPSRSCA